MRKLLVVGLLGAWGCAMQGPSTEGVEALTVDVHTSEVLMGTYAEGGWLVEFESVMTSPTTSEMHLAVNGQQLDARVDHEAMTGWWTGHDGALYADDLAALSGFLRELLDYLGGEYDLAPHEDLLFRRVNYWSEAPPGLTLGEREVAADIRPQAERLPPEGAIVSESDAEALGPAPEGLDEVFHRGSDEDGIAYLYCNRYSWAVHDSSSHCKNWESIYAGPNASSCHGKCGAGCVGAGYTYDCHDHDRCGRVHGGSTNPWDGNCGDEYFEADDDFWWSIIGKCY